MLLPFTHAQIISFHFCLDHFLARGGIELFIISRLLSAVPIVVAGLLLSPDGFHPLGCPARERNVLHFLTRMVVRGRTLPIESFPRLPPSSSSS